MKCKFIEALNVEGKFGINYGKFAVCEFEQVEWDYRQRIELPVTQMELTPLLRSQGWGDEHRFVIDLFTGVGIMICLGSEPQVNPNLGCHEVWVCPFFIPFLDWLYTQGDVPVETLPDLVWLLEPLEKVVDSPNSVEPLATKEQSYV